MIDTLHACITMENDWNLVYWKTKEKLEVQQNLW